MSHAFGRYLLSFLIIVAVLATVSFLIVPSMTSAYQVNPANSPFKHKTPTPIPTQTGTPSPSPTGTPSPTPTPTPPPGAAPQLEVVGNQLIDKNTGQPIQLHGVVRDGTEYSCVTPISSGTHHYTVFPDKKGPTTTEIADMQANWHINAVRIPLNEQCWLKTPELPAGSKAGVIYQKEIQGYVSMLNQAGLVAILDLHYSAPAGILAYRQESMPDSSYSVAFWTSVAQTFAGNDAVVFDAFSEPVPPIDPANGTYDANSWTCWLKGQTFSGDANTCATGCPDYYDGQNGNTLQFNCVGMQALVQAIRTASSPAPNNVIMLGGVENATEFNLWNQYLPIDPNTGQAYTNLTLSAHMYLGRDFDQASLTQQLQNGYPVIAGEVGGGTVTQIGYTNDDFLLPTLSYLDNPNGDGSIPAQSYLAWHWNGDNGDNMALITDFVPGDPSICYGQAYQAHLTGGSPPTCP